MADLKRFRSLSDDEKILVAVGVLLDGHDAATYLSVDADRGTALQRVAGDIAELDPGLRMPLIGTLLREAVARRTGTRGQ